MSTNRLSEQTALEKQRIHLLKSSAARSIWQEVANAASIAALSLPVWIGLAGWLKFLFPLASILVTLFHLARGKASQALTFCFWLFLLTPWVRRVSDFHAGWTEQNLILLTPYYALSFTLPAMAALFVRPEINYRKFILIPFCVVLYGLILAICSGRISGGLYDFLRWTIPISTVAFLLINPEIAAKFRHDFNALVLVAVPVLSAYAAYQFIFAPSWDVFWMKQVEISGLGGSIGKPEPYGIRVFSTHNFPGQFALFLMAGLSFLLCSGSKIRWLGIAMGCVAISLTSVRTAWLGLALVVVMLVLVGPTRAKIYALASCGALALLAPLAAVIPELYELVEQRVESFSNLKGDTSAIERASDYARFVVALNDHVMGLGLGLTSIRDPAAGSFQVIDGGFIHVFMSFGVLGGVMFLACVVLLIYAGFIRVLKLRDPIDAACLATGSAYFMVLTSTNSFIASDGALFWLCLILPLIPKMTLSATTAF